MKVFKWLIIMQLVWSCKSTQTSSSTETLPEWATQRPKTDYYYVGIAKVDKALHKTDYQDAAKRMALNDLASEISVKIESNSLLSSYDDNAGYSQDYQQFIKTEINKELSGYEMVANFENKLSYYVYYQLSKSAWAQIQARQKSEAGQRALNWYRKAQSETQKLAIPTAIQYHLNGLLEIKKYWSEAVQVSDSAGTYRIDETIKNDLSNLLSSLAWDVKPESVLLKSDNGFRSPIEIGIKVGSAFVSNLPVQVRYKKRQIPYQQSFLTQNKPLSVSVEQTDMQKSMPQVSIDLELNKLIKMNADDKKMLAFVYDAIKLQTIQIPIKIEMPKVYIAVKSDGKYQSTYFHYLKDAMSQVLSRERIDLAPSIKDADFLIHVEPHESKGPDDQKFKTVFLSYNIEIVRQSDQKLVHSQAITQIKVVDGSYEKATEKSYQKAAEAFNTEHYSSFLNGLMK